MDVTDISLVVTDLDGTLWEPDGTVHERTLDALAQLEHRGVPLLVATGRRRRSAASWLERVGLTPPAVLLDGALGSDLATGEDFHAITYEPEAAAATLDAFRDHGVEPCVYVLDPDVDVLLGASPSTHPAHLESLGDAARRADLDRAVWEAPVVSIGVVAGDPEVLEAVAAAAAEVAAPTVTRDVVHGSVTLMVPARGVSKWDGVVAYCEQVDLDPGAVLAIGDGHNDLDLLASARIACAVSDGCEEALALADHVVPTPDQGGWAHLLDYLPSRPR